MVIGRSHDCRIRKSRPHNRLICIIGAPVSGSMLDKDLILWRCLPLLRLTTGQTTKWACLGCMWNANMLESEGIWISAISHQWMGHRSSGSLIMVWAPRNMPQLSTSMSNARLNSGCMILSLKTWWVMQSPHDRDVTWAPRRLKTQEIRRVFSRMFELTIKQTSKDCFVTT